MEVSAIPGEELFEYIKELDHVFSRLLWRLRILLCRYTADKITDTQIIVLRALCKGPCNTTCLARLLGVTLSAVTALINRLFKMGLVTRERRDKDRRQVWISITPKGRQLLQEVEDRRYMLMAIYFSRIPEAEREEILRLFNLVIELFEQDDILNLDSLPGSDNNHTLSE